MAHVRQSRPDSGLHVEAKVIECFELFSDRGTRYETKAVVRMQANLDEKMTNVAQCGNPLECTLKSFKMHSTASSVSRLPTTVRVKLVTSLSVFKHRLWHKLNTSRLPHVIYDVPNFIRTALDCPRRCFTLFGLIKVVSPGSPLRCHTLLSAASTLN